MKLNRNYAESTVYNYTKSVEYFNEFLVRQNKRVEECEKITIRDVENFIARERRNKDSRTCNNLLAGIKCFFRYCTNQWKKVIDTKGLMTMREYDKKIDSLTEQQVCDLLNYLKEIKVRGVLKERLKLRNLAIVTTLLYTWLRVSELRNLKYTDLQDDGIQIIGKWWKRRVVYINEEVENNIVLYNMMRTDKSPYIFVSHSSQKTTRLSRNAIEEFLRKAWKACGIENLTPHRLRHTFATMLLKRQAEIFYIQKLLWHKNFSTTEEYLTVLSENSKKTQSLLDDLIKL